MTGSSPTVVGALIAGGAAMVGFGASAVTTGLTLRANRRLARDQLLWARNTELYEELAALIDSAGRSRKPQPDHAKGFLDLLPRVQLYASVPVRSAYRRLINTFAVIPAAKTAADNRLFEALQAALLDLQSRIRSDVQGDSRNWMIRFIIAVQRLPPARKTLRGQESSVAQTADVDEA